MSQIDAYSRRINLKFLGGFFAFGFQTTSICPQSLTSRTVLRRWWNSKKSFESSKENALSLLPSKEFIYFCRVMNFQACWIVRREKKSIFKDSPIYIWVIFICVSCRNNIWAEKVILLNHVFNRNFPILFNEWMSVVDKNLILFTVFNPIYSLGLLKFICEIKLKFQSNVCVAFERTLL
jgi:hypothetical protein